MTSRPTISAPSKRALLVAGAALATYLSVAFTGCSSDSPSGSGSSGSTTSGPSGSGGASGTGTGTSTGTGKGGATGTGTTTGTTATGTGGTGTTSTGTTATGTGGTGTTSTSTTGTGGAGPTTTTTGTGGTGTGTGGAGGTGGGTTSGCDPDPPGNRCVPSPAASPAGDTMVDDLEPATGDTATCHRIKEVAGRKGSWISGKDPKSPNGSVKHTFDMHAAGAPAELGKRAIHVVGTGLNGWGGDLAVTLAPCYNASNYKGISFWVKGDPSKASWLKVSVVTPGTTEASGGGRCIQPPDPHGPAELECYDHFSVNLFKVSDQWTRYAITWQQLAQFGWGQKIPGTYRPETEIVSINFATDWGSEAANKATNKSFDFWIDNLTLEPAGPFSDGFKNAISEASFNGAYPSRNMFYGNPHAQLATALDDPRFSRIAREGTADDRKREIAALMAHIWQETGGLQYVTELNPPDAYCRANDPVYPCVAGKTYIGRGPLQLSWNYNYGQASEYFGLGKQLLDNPDLVATDATLSWRAALFFWMAWRDKDGNSLLVGPHYRMMHDGFGATIRAINGALECGAGNAAANARRDKYRTYCGMLGVTPEANLDCPPM